METSVVMSLSSDSLKVGVVKKDFQLPHDQVRITIRTENVVFYIKRKYVPELIAALTEVL